MKQRFSEITKIEIIAIKMSKMILIVIIKINYNIHFSFCYLAKQSNQLIILQIIVLKYISNYLFIILFMYILPK